MFGVGRLKGVFNTMQIISLVRYSSNNVIPERLFSVRATDADTGISNILVKIFMNILKGSTVFILWVIYSVVTMPTCCLFYIFIKGCMCTTKYRVKMIHY